MPNTLKEKLRQYDKATRKARKLHEEIEAEFEKYNVPYENLVANEYEGKCTEALAFISYCEGNIEENIADIEEVFLHFVNKQK